jgi:ubiquinone/menaquinone biosynthesis C-methylase UbiE
LPKGKEMTEVLLKDVIDGQTPSRVLDLGTGGGALIADIRTKAPHCEAVGLDISPPLLAAARMRFARDKAAHFHEHDLADPLPADLGSFDLIVSAWVIHHLPDERKRSLYDEVYRLLEPGGKFCNIDLVAMRTPELQRRALEVFASISDEDDRSDQPARVGEQLSWLTESGFVNVDCYWKWLATGMLVGERASS